MKKKKLSDDDLFERREHIGATVHMLVDALTDDLVESQDEELRQTMTEQFRFWRRG